MHAPRLETRKPSHTKHVWCLLRSGEFKLRFEFLREMSTLGLSTFFNQYYYDSPTEEGRSRISHRNSLLEREREERQTWIDGLCDVRGLHILFEKWFGGNSMGILHPTHMASSSHSMCIPPDCMWHYEKNYIFKTYLQSHSHSHSDSDSDSQSLSSTLLLE
jgi:hypothetical protein